MYQPVCAGPLFPVGGQDPWHGERVVEQPLLHKDLPRLHAEEDVGEGEEATLDAAPVLGVIWKEGEGYMIIIVRGEFEVLGWGSKFAY